MNRRLIPFFFYALIMAILWVAAIASGKTAFILVPGVLTASYVVVLPMVLLAQKRRRQR